MGLRDPLHFSDFYYILGPGNFTLIINTMDFLVFSYDAVFDTSDASFCIWAKFWDGISGHSDGTFGIQ